jgi:hypothetical protein
MNSSEAVLSFISYPWLTAFLFLLVLISLALIKKDLMDGVMRYMSARFELDYLFQASSTEILLFVDASTTSKLSLMGISDISELGRYLNR